MTPIDPARWGPAPAISLLDYPGRTPDQDWLHTDEGVVLLADGELDDALERRGVAPRSDRVAVICAGSNANPAQVVRKLARVRGDRTVPHARVRVTGAGPVYSAHVARYGAIPATFDRLPGTHPIHVGWYTPEQLAAVEVSEAGAYDLVVIDDPAVTLDVDGPVRVWLSHAGPLQQGGAPVPLGDQRALLARLLTGLTPAAYAADPARHKARLQARLVGGPHRIGARARRAFHGRS